MNLKAIKKVPPVGLKANLMALGEGKGNHTRKRLPGVQKAAAETVNGLVPALVKSGLSSGIPPGPERAGQAVLKEQGLSGLKENRMIVLAGHPLRINPDHTEEAKLPARKQTKGANAPIATRLAELLRVVRPESHSAIGKSHSLRGHHLLIKSKGQKEGLKKGPPGQGPVRDNLPGSIKKTGTGNRKAGL